MKNISLLGAIAGDVIGSEYEFNATKRYNFKLLSKYMSYTDDSIMTVAVADWLIRGRKANNDFSTELLINTMRKWGNRYPTPMGAYGGMFSNWLFSNDPQPYNSFGNGSAMRVSPCGFAFNSLEETLAMAERSAIVTHNHPEGIKGAQATAAAIFLARNGKSKDEIRDYISTTFGYNLNRTCDEIRPDYSFEGSCQETVPQSIIAFLDSKDYEDAIRLTVSLGGDADTMGAITGAIAIAFYKEMPDEIYNFVTNLLPNDMKRVIENFSEMIV